MKRRVLVVEDDELMGTSLCRALEASGYATERAISLAAARLLVAEQRPDLVLLDRSLPDGDGLALCAELTHSGPVLPIIVLTARSEEIDVVLGLNAGAVDYVTKPFRLAELLARVETHLRTAGVRAAAADDVLCQGDLRIDVPARRVWLDEAEVELRPREFDLLARLVRDAGKVLQREDLISELWDEHWFGSTKTLDVHVAHLRRKLGEPPGTPSRIASIRGVGYRFETTR